MSHVIPPGKCTESKVVAQVATINKSRFILFHVKAIRHQHTPQKPQNQRHISPFLQTDSGKIRWAIPGQLGRVKRKKH